MRTTERSAQGSAFDGTFSASTGKQRDGRPELVAAHFGYILCNSTDFTILSIVYSAGILGHSFICCLRDNTNGLWPNLGFEPSEQRVHFTAQGGLSLSGLCQQQITDTIKRIWPAVIVILIGENNADG